MGKQCEYNPLMEAKWVFVADKGGAVDYSTGIAGAMMASRDRAMARRTEIHQWCDDNTHGRWCFKDGYSTTTYGFKGKKDAVLFKLTWGGV